MLMTEDKLRIRHWFKNLMSRNATICLVCMDEVTMTAHWWCRQHAQGYRSIVVRVWRFGSFYGEKHG